MAGLNESQLIAGYRATPLEDCPGCGRAYGEGHVPGCRVASWGGPTLAASEDHPDHGLFHAAVRLVQESDAGQPMLAGHVLVEELAAALGLPMLHERRRRYRELLEGMLP